MMMLMMVMMLTMVMMLMIMMMMTMMKMMVMMMMMMMLLDEQVLSVKNENERSYANTSNPQLDTLFAESSPSSG